MKTKIERFIKVQKEIIRVKKLELRAKNWDNSDIYGYENLVGDIKGRQAVIKRLERIIYY